MDKVTFFDIYEVAVLRRDSSWESAPWPPAVMAWCGDLPGRSRILSMIASDVGAGMDDRAVPLIHEVLASINQEPSQ